MTKLKEALKRIENLERYNAGLANESCTQQEKIRELESLLSRLKEGGAWRGLYLDVKTENSILINQLKRKQAAYSELENAANKYAERVRELEKEQGND